MTVVSATGVIDPAVRSWVRGADESGFPLQHLPLGVGTVGDRAPSLWARIGDRAVDLQGAAELGLLASAPAAPATGAPSLNQLLALGADAWHDLRRRLVDLLATHGAVHLPQRLLVDVDDLRLRLPVEVGDYVDFYSSIEHATNVGRLFRPDDEPLLPNWRHLPVGYHGRAGTVVVSGTGVRRPCGQRAPEGADRAPAFGPSTKLDIELELAFVTGGPRAHVATADVEEVVFGVALLNDWSARDIQNWEYRPLGPFLGKSFATSLAGWITPLPALAPFRVPQPPQEPAPLDYLAVQGNWGLDLDLEVGVSTTAMREHGKSDTVISRTSAAGLWWTIPQQIAHATVNGATTRPGDLYGTGTISGATPGSQGSLLELTHDGRLPVAVDGDTTRAWLEDGDEVVLRGSAARDGHPRITLAEVRGTILPA